MKQFTPLFVLVGLALIGCGTKEEVGAPSHFERRLSIKCGFCTTKVSHTIEDGFFKSQWQQGDTITVLIDDEYRYYVADNDGSSTTFSLSDEHSSGFTKWDGLTAYAITGRVTIKDNNYALLEENMGNQTYSPINVPMDYQFGSATIHNSEVSFLFSYPCSFLRMSIPKQTIAQNGGRFIIDITGDYPFVIGNNTDDWVNDVSLVNYSYNPASMPELDENNNWSAQSYLYPHLMLNMLDGRYLSYYDSGNTNNMRFDNSAYYSFPEGTLDAFQDEELVPFYVAFCPEYRFAPINEYRYLIRLYDNVDRGNVLYEKCAPVGELHNNTVYDVNPESRYYSTDYTMDGTPVVINKSSIGNGVDVVFMGEGYTDKDMGEGGLYERDMRDAFEHLFSYEPLASYKDYFNVYCVKVVSPYYDAHDADSPINEIEQIRKYYNDVSGINTDVLRVVVLKRFSTDVMKSDNMNSTDTEPSYTVNYTDGSFIIRMNHKYNVQRILLHEFMHGIAKVADEYVVSPNTIDDETINELKSLHSIGFCLNIDTTDNSEDVLWAHLLNDNRFQEEGLRLYVGNLDFGDKKEGLDIFEGGWLKYGKGVYRPSYYSLMNNNHHGVWEEWMNAPTREALYKHVMRAAFGDEWVYDYEAFVTFDKPYRDFVMSSIGSNSVPVQNSVVVGNNLSYRHIAPMIGGESPKTSKFSFGSWGVRTVPSEPLPTRSNVRGSYGAGSAGKRPWHRR